MTRRAVTRRGAIGASVRALDPARAITVVSGLPRSGTSMMMQMLEAAGLEIASDRKRGPDADNPRGYYEYEPVTRLRTDSAFLAGMRGCAIKIVAPLLPFLPRGHEYRVIFMERDLDEVLDSQREMLSRLSSEGGAGRGTDEAALKRAFARQLRRVELWLGQQDGVRTCFVSHEATLSDPAATARLVVDFLGIAGSGDDHLASTVYAMARVVDPNLHRQRHRPGRATRC